MFTLDPYREPWTRQPDEPDNPWLSFVHFRDSGENFGKRTYIATAEANAVSAATVSKWASEYLWDVRVRAYDAHIDELRRAEHYQNIQKMNTRHAQVAQMATTVLQLIPQVLIRRLKDNPDELWAALESMPLSDLFDMTRQSAHSLKHLSEIERNAYGLAEETMKVAKRQHVEENQEQLDEIFSDPESRRAMRLLAEKMSDTPTADAVVVEVSTEGEDE